MVSSDDELLWLTEVLPGYEPQRILGRGASGVVVLALDRRLGRAVAIKVLDADEGGQREMLRFSREARLYAALQHPNLVRFYDAELAARPPFIVLEYVDGSTLKDALVDGRRLAPHRVGQELASALAYVHERGILHRDLKPSNVLLRADGSTLLGDFGLAKVLRADVTALTADGSLLGTLSHMAPEILRGEPHSRESDLYSLALILYEVAVGAPVFVGGAPGTVRPDERVQGKIPPLADRGATLPDALERCLMQALSLDPARRPTPAELLQALRRSGSAAASGGRPRERAAAGASAGAATPSGRSGSRRPTLHARAGRRWAPGLVGAALTMALLSAWVVRSGSERPPFRPSATPAPVALHESEDRLRQWVLALDPRSVGPREEELQQAVDLVVQARHRSVRQATPRPDRSTVEADDRLERARTSVRGWFRRRVPAVDLAELLPQLPRLGRDRSIPAGQKRALYETVAPLSVLDRIATDCLGQKLFGVQQACQDLLAVQFQAASPGGRSLLAGHPDPELSDRVRRHGLTIWCGDPEATDEMCRSVASEVVRRAVQETRFLKGPGRSLVLTLRVQASDADKALVLGLKVCTLGMENWIEATLNDRFSAHLTADPARCSPPLNILTWDNASRQTLEASSFWIVVRFPPGWLLEGDNSIRLSLHCLSPTPRIVASVRPVWLFEVTAGPA